MGGWRGDRGSYVVSPTPPVSPLGKGRALGGEGGGGGGGEGPKGQGQGAGMGAFRVERGSKSRGSRLRIRSPFRKKEKEEARRSFIFAFEEQPPEKTLREAEGGLVLNEEYTAMIEKKEKQLLNEAEEVQTVEDVEEGEEGGCRRDDHLHEVDTEDNDAHEFAKNSNVEIRDPENKNNDEQDEMAVCSQSRSSVLSEDNDVDDEEDYNMALEDNKVREGTSLDKNIDNYCIKNEDNDVESVESSAISVDTAREVLEGVIEGEDMMAEAVQVEEEVEDKVEEEVEDKVEDEVEDAEVKRQENQPKKEESREGTERDELSQLVSDGPRKDGEGGQGGECGQAGVGGEAGGEEEVGLGVQLLSPQHRGKLDGPGGNDNMVVII